MTRDENFSKDIRVLSSLPKNVIEHLAEHAIEVWLAPSEPETEAVADRASRKLRVNRAQLDHVFRISNFLIVRFLKDGEGHDDEPDDIVLDLETTLDLSFEDKRDSILSYVTELKKGVEQKVDMATNRKRYAQRSLPVLESISATANYRLVFDEDFGVRTRVSSYQPKCLDTVPVGIIKLAFSSGPTKEVFFQADRRAIRLLIDHLEAIDKQLDIARKHFDLQEG